MPSKPQIRRPRGRAGAPLELVEKSLDALISASDDQNASGQSGIPEWYVVFALLEDKWFALDTAIAEIDERIPDANPKQLRSLRRLRQRAEDEQRLVKARKDAIYAGRPFRSPPESQKLSLVDAIKAVGVAAARNSAISTLITAIGEVIKAYRASSTIPLST